MCNTMSPIYFVDMSHYFTPKYYTLQDVLEYLAQCAERCLFMMTSNLPKQTLEQEQDVTCFSQITIEECTLNPWEKTFKKHH